MINAWRERSGLKVTLDVLSAQVSVHSSLYQYKRQALRRWFECSSQTRLQGSRSMPEPKASCALACCNQGVGARQAAHYTLAWEGARGKHSLFNQSPGTVSWRACIAPSGLVNSKWGTRRLAVWAAQATELVKSGLQSPHLACEKALTGCMRDPGLLVGSARSMLCSCTWIRPHPRNGITCGDMFLQAVQGCGVYRVGICNVIST
jgi:hypothetical protein